MNKKLILGIIIVLVILIVICVALLIAGPKADSPTNNSNQDELATDLENLSSGDTILDQNIDSDIVDIGE